MSARTTSGKTSDRPISPEELGRRIGCSGATVRRWEADLLAPDEDEIARIAEVCHLSPHQTAFLSAAFSRAQALPPPPDERFRSFMTAQLSVPYPAVVLDSLSFFRACNSYVPLDLAAPTVTSADPHTVTSTLKLAAADEESDSMRETVRDVIRIFWMETARLSHRPEYAKLIGRLSAYPEFCEVWQDLATGDDSGSGPISQARPATYGDRRYLIFTRRIFFPPEYQVLVFMPDNEAARRALEAERAQGPPEATFLPPFHWLEGPLSSRSADR